MRLTCQRVVYAAAAVLVMAGCRSEKSGSAGDGSTTVTIYYSDEANVPSDCEAVVSEEWIVDDPSTTDIPTVAIQRVLQPVMPSSRLHRPGTGPLLQYFRGVRVEASTAILMFDEQALEYLNNAACAQMSVKAPIARTLLGLPGIDGVEYEIEGRIFRDWDA